MTRVKICGITDTRSLDAAVAAGADAVGFIVEVPVETHRCLSADQAASLVDEAPPFVTTVAVTMASDPDAVAAIADRTGCDTLQLHGIDDAARADAIATAVDARVLFALSPTSPAVADLAAHGDGLVIDSLDAAGAGGSGDVHEWERTARLVDQLEVPIVLAGGLTPENVGEAIDTAAPFAVDVATGVESRDGQTDPSTARRFVESTRGTTEARA